MFNENSIKLSPYLARSKKLIEFFVIIGYKEENIIENCPNLLNNQNNLELTIISICSTNNPIKNINFDSIINNTYPNKPKIIKIDRPEIKPKINSVIFSACFNINKKKQEKEIEDKNEEEKGKSFYSCYGLRFYEKFKDPNTNIEYYIPKAFLIISEYPYFSIFHKICLNIYKINIEEKDNILLKNKSKNKIKIESYEKDKIPLEIFIYFLINYIPSPINNNIILKLFNNEKDILIPKMNGYPYIDFDLCQVFNIIPINEFIKLYILIFLEVPLILFCDDLMKLSVLMYSLYILNYPLIDSLYLSYLTFIKKKENGYDIAIPSCLGVNAQYNSDFQFKGNMIKVVFDSENKRFYHKNLDDESTQIKNLLEYINNILINKKQIKSEFLLKNVSLLKLKLEHIIHKYNKKIRGYSKTIFYINENINSLNIEVQEAFYDFNLNIIIILNKNYEIDKSCSSIEAKKLNKKKNNLSEEEFFLKALTLNDKYTLYFNNFISNFIAEEEFRISFLIFDELAQQRRYDLQNKIPQFISYFKIIKNFYSMTNDSITIDYNNLFKEYKELNNRSIIEKTKKINANSQLFYLDKNIINTLLYFIKNKKDILKTLKEIEKKEINIDSMEKISIFTTIEKCFSKILNPNYYIRASLVYIFSIVFPILSSNTINKYLSSLLENINKMEYFQRSYLYIILRSINKYYLINKEKNQFSELNYENIKKYCQKIKDYLNDYSILPNEEIILLLKEIMNNDNRNIKNNNNSNNNHNFVFKYDKVENYVNEIKYDIVEKEDDTLIFKFKGTNVEVNFLSFDMIFQQSSLIYDDYFSRINFNIEAFPIKSIINININLIYYLLLPKYNEKDMALFLFKTINVLNTLEKDLNEYNEKNR